MDACETEDKINLNELEENTQIGILQGYSRSVSFKMSWFISVNKAFANKNILQGFVVGTSVIPVPPEVKVEEWQIQGYLGLSEGVPISI